MLNAQDDELIRLQEEMNDLNWEDESQHERLVIINGDSQPLRRKKIRRRWSYCHFFQSIGCRSSFTYSECK